MAKKQDRQGCQGQAPEELRESEEKYRSVTQTSIDAIITTDGESTVLTWNSGAERMFGYGPEMVGRQVLAIIPEKYRQAHLDGVRRFLATGEKHLIGQVAELSALRADGGEFPIELSLSTWRSARGVFFGGIVRDISERKRLERLREDVHRMIRHDLKSPLIGITGMAGLLLKGEGLSDKQRSMAEKIRELGEKTLTFIERARELFQMEQGLYQLEPAPVDLPALVARVGEELAPLLRARRVRLVQALAGFPEPGQLPSALGEAALLEVMLENLLKNAVEASPPGGQVRVALGWEDSPGGPWLVLDVHNQGAVPAEVREKFFEAYVTSGKAEGTGLGTYSALLVARTHGGDISFTTSEEQGTHLVVRLPAARAAQAGPPPEPSGRQPK